MIPCSVVNKYLLLPASGWKKNGWNSLSLQNQYMRFEVLVAVNIKIIVFWDMRRCNVVDRYQWNGTSRYLSTKLYGIMSQKTIILSLCNFHF
jgi:hypothetical protein